MLAKIYLLLLVATTALAVPALKFQVPESPIKPLVDYGNANHIMDAVLFKVNHNMPDYIELGDLGGTFNFKDCYFLGLQNGIHRDGDATVMITGNVAQFNCPFKMTGIGINCSWSYPELYVHGKCDAISDKAEIGSGIGILEESGQHPWLTEFVVIEMDPVKADITGLIGLNWLAEDITNLILRNADEAITSVIENQVADIFQEVLNTIVIP